jgi:F0F1-type ATP synthase assembly protein I
MGPKPESDEGRESRVVRHARTARTLGGATAIPTMILVGLLGGYFLGHWLEGRYGHEPWLSFAGLVVGGVASVRKVVQVLQQEQHRKD